LPWIRESPEPGAFLPLPDHRHPYPVGVCTRRRIPVQVELAVHGQMLLVAIADATQLAAAAGLRNRIL
jgi:hypothetical protein